MKEISENKITSQLTESISQLLVAARQKIVAQVNDTLVQTYSQTDRMIVEDEQNHNDRAEYGKQTIKKLSRALTERFGKGVFSCQFAEYETSVLEIRKKPIADWQIDLDALLRYVSEPLCPRGE